MVYSEIPFGRSSFSHGDQSVAKHCESTDWFLYGTHDSFINNLCVKICSSSSTLQFFHIPPNNVSGILWKRIVFFI